MSLSPISSSGNTSYYPSYRMDATGSNQSQSGKDKSVQGGNSEIDTDSAEKKSSGISDKKKMERNILLKS